MVVGTSWDTHAINPDLSTDTKVVLISPSGTQTEITDYITSVPFSKSINNLIGECSVTVPGTYWLSPDEYWCMAVEYLGRVLFYGRVTNCQQTIAGGVLSTKIDGVDFCDRLAHRLVPVDDVTVDASITMSSRGCLNAGDDSSWCIIDLLGGTGWIDWCGIDPAVDDAIEEIGAGEFFQFEPGTNCLQAIQAICLAMGAMFWLEYYRESGVYYCYAQLQLTADVIADHTTVYELNDSHVVPSSFTRLQAPEFCYNKLTVERTNYMGTVETATVSTGETPVLEKYLSNPIPERAQVWTRTVQISQQLTLSALDTLEVGFMVRGKSYRPAAEDDPIRVYMTNGTDETDLMEIETLNPDVWEDPLSGHITSLYTNPWVVIEFGEGIDCCIDNVTYNINSGGATNFPDSDFSSGVFGTGTDGKWKREYTDSTSIAVAVIESDCGYYASSGLHCYTPAYTADLTTYATALVNNYKKARVRYEVDVWGYGFDLFDIIDVSPVMETLGYLLPSYQFRVSEYSFELSATGVKTSLHLVDPSFIILDHLSSSGAGKYSADKAIIDAITKTVTPIMHYGVVASVTGQECSVTADLGGTIWGRVRGTVEVGDLVRYYKISLNPSVRYVIEPATQPPHTLIPI